MFTSTHQSIAKKAILAGAVATALLSCPLQAHASNVVHVDLKGETVAMRLYNPWTGEHLFSENGYEVQNLSANGWNFESFAWKSEGDAHVYRLYNPYEQDHYHHFTTDRNEADARVADGWRYEGIAWYVAPVEMVEKDGTLSPKGAGDSTSADGAGIYNLTTAANTNNESAGAADTTSTAPEATNDTATPGKRWVVDKPAWTETKWTATTKYMNGHYISVSTTDPNDLVHIEDKEAMQAWREGKYPSIKTEEEAREEFWTTKLAMKGEKENCKYQHDHEFKPGEAGNWTELPLKTEIIEHPAEGHWE